MTIAQVFDDAIIQSPYESPIIVTYKGQKMTRGDRAIAWIEEYCRVPSGASTGKRVSLLPFQKDFLKRVYDNPRKTRRAILSIGRKNGKTAICAFLMLLHLVGPEAVRNGQLYSAARSTKQAGILFELAAKTVLMSPKLKNLIHVVHGRSYMRCERYGTVATSPRRYLAVIQSSHRRSRSTAAPPLVTARPAMQIPHLLPLVQRDARAGRPKTPTGPSPCLPCPHRRRRASVVRQ